MLALPADLLVRATAHASWAQPRSESYERLAFVGDSLLSQIVTLELHRTYTGPDDTAGKLTRIRAGVVADSVIRDVALSIGLDRVAVDCAPEGERANAARLVSSGKPLASMFEALIAACWFHHGEERTSAAVISTLADVIERARVEPADEKSLLQEELARRGDTVSYQSQRKGGPAHQPEFEATAILGSDGSRLATGRGPSKKLAERQAAALSLQELIGDGE